MGIFESLDPAFVRDILSSLNNTIGTPGSTPPTKAVVIGGYDGTNVQRVKTTTDGKLLIYLG